MTLRAHEMPGFWSSLIYKSGVVAAPASHEIIQKGLSTSQGIVGLERMGRMFRASSIQVHVLLGLRTKNVSHKTRIP